MRLPVENESEMEESKEDGSKRFIDKVVKANRGLFILSSLMDAKMCGYDIIRAIFLKYDVFLNQGSVYPILYTLEEEGILQAEYSEEDMRTKKYGFTPMGKEIGQKETEAFIKAVDRINVLIRREENADGCQLQPGGKS